MSRSLIDHGAERAPGTTADADAAFVQTARAAGLTDEEVQDLVASALLTLPRATRSAPTSPTPAR
ncbi:hypothetical protein LFM56_09405 [Cellulomonas iranensis]|uniref:hypothetical protein n=1 Tax=Cellulomonas iranensis TaxID=76862 RepID=UPI001CF5EBA8|nr:hypothetical protein [Cellulomonas iranensis]UCN13151.1 hypothetical protein LFM56_09405 [Cellulomonas iranensis]